MDQAKTNNETKRFRSVLVILTPALLKRLDAEARRKTISRSALIRQVCEATLPIETRQEVA